MSDALFDLPGVNQPPAPEEPKLSADRRRTLRQYKALLAGQHPIGLLLRRVIKLHPNAAPPDDRKATGLRCRDCRFREPFGYHTRSYHKCTRAGEATITHSAASDVRGWWPACLHYEPAEATNAAP